MKGRKFDTADLEELFHLYNVEDSLTIAVACYFNEILDKLDHSFMEDEVIKLSKLQHLQMEDVNGEWLSLEDIIEDFQKYDIEHISEIQVFDSHAIDYSDSEEYINDTFVQSFQVGD
jgi:hypothetical protein